MRFLPMLRYAPLFDAAVVATGGVIPPCADLPDVIWVDPDPLATPDSDGGDVWIGVGWWHHVVPAEPFGPRRVTVCGIELDRDPALTLAEYVPEGIPECRDCSGEA